MPMGASAGGSGRMPNDNRGLSGALLAAGGRRCPQAPVPAPSRAGQGTAPGPPTLAVTAGQGAVAGGRAGLVPGLPRAVRAGPRPGSARPPRRPTSTDTPARRLPQVRGRDTCHALRSVISVLGPAPSVVHGPADLLATIPYVLGYHPHESVVVLFVTGDGRLTCALCVGRQAPDSLIIAESSTAASRADANRAFVVGYRPQSDRDRLAGIADSLNMAVTVQACLLVDDGRYYCLNDGCPCTPEHGAALDPSSTVIAAEMTLDGRVALPSREDFNTFVAPDPDAQARTAAALNRVPDPLADPVAVVNASLDIASAGDQLNDEQAAYLVVALQDNDGRGAAWAATTGETWQHDLWLDLIRRVPEHCVAAPANLVA
ncbi:DUF4192 domain-containing protein [Actinoplanes sp. NPDC026619]|uniref:DUF4192 domain-containing protein n=1 Tax=Actinoplanes sp. NPDC026619 TaxID=3155798 RepID=UPI0033E51435